MKYTIEDIYKFDRDRDSCIAEIRSVKKRYNSLFRSSIDARIAVMRETALYGYFCKAVKDLKSGSDTSAKKLISTTLGIDIEDTKDVSYRNFLTEQNHYDDVRAIRFKYTIHPVEHDITFELQAPNLDSLGFTVNPYRSVEYDFDSFEGIIQKLNFTLCKVLESYTGDSRSILAKSLGVDDTFRLKYMFEKCVKATEKRIAKEKENENT